MCNTQPTGIGLYTADDLEQGMPHAQVMRSIELFGNEVAPAVRKALRAGG